MLYSIDAAVFIGFLMINIAAGLSSSRNVKTIKEYAIGNRNFSTITIAATLVATWVSGDTFFTQLSEIYSNGLYFIWAQFGEVVCFLLIAFFFAHRMDQFLGKLSIAEAMGDLYGRNVRLITAASGLIGAGGMIAMQLKVAGLLFEYAFNVSSLYGVAIGGAIITIYSSLGGIRSVTFTDIVQLFTFGTIIPTIAFFILSSLDNIDVLINTVTKSSSFDYIEVFDFTRPKSLYYAFIFLFIAIPGFNPAIFQRIAMAKNTLQVRQSFIIAAITCIFVTGVTFWVGTLVLSMNPDLEGNDIVQYILSNFSYIGLRGLTLAGIMAMVMSTADSYVNSTSILLIHDICIPLKIKITKNELVASRIASIFIGIFAIILALRSDSLLHLLIAANMFYMPIVTVPFIMTAFGFRTSNKSVLIGMGAGFCTVILWETFCHIEEIDGLIPGMIANLLFLIGSHYLLKQPGGWVGVKDSKSLIQVRRRRNIKVQNVINSVRSFNLAAFLRSNSLQNEAMYVYFGLFCIVSIYSITYTLPKQLQSEYHDIINFMYMTALFMATTLIGYPVWPLQWKKTNIIAIIWNICIFYVLIFVGFLLVIMSHFAQFQLMIFMTNLVVIAILVRWQWAILLITIGIVATINVFAFYLENSVPENFTLTKFESAYILLLVSGVLIIFLKPRQQNQEISEFVKNYLNYDNEQKQRELIKLSQYREEFINKLDKHCVKVFKSVHQQIHSFEQKFNKTNCLDKEDIITIINKLKLGAEYLDQLIFQVKNVLKIKPTKISLSSFIYNIINEYIRININNVDIGIDLQTKVEEIEIDADLIRRVIFTCMNHARAKSSDCNIVVTAYDTELEYDLNNTMKIRRDAVVLAIIVNNITLVKADIDLLLQPTFNTINELNFIEIHKIITAHYGKFKLNISQVKQVTYSITIPCRLKEIRPKKMDLI